MVHFKCAIVQKEHIDRVRFVIASISKKNVVHHYNIIAQNEVSKLSSESVNDPRWWVRGRRIW